MGSFRFQVIPQTGFKHPILCEHIENFSGFLQDSQFMNPHQMHRNINRSLTGPLQIENY
jgi:hypothetical protein